MLPIEIRFDDDLKQLRQYLSPQALARSVSRANRTAASRASVQGSVALRKRFKVKASEVKGSLVISGIDAGDGVYHQQLTYRGVRLGLHRFAAKAKKITLKGRQKRPFGRKRTGVTIKIRADRPRKLVKGAFMVTTRGGKTLVFRRVGKRRFPIRTLSTLSIPEMMRIPGVSSALLKTAEDVFPKEFERLMNYEMEKLIR